MRHPLLNQEQRNRIATKVWYARRQTRELLATPELRIAMVRSLLSDRYDDVREYADALINALEAGSYLRVQRIRLNHYKQPGVLHPSGMTPNERQTVARNVVNYRIHLRQMFAQHAQHPELAEAHRQKMEAAVAKETPERKGYAQARLDAFTAGKPHRLVRLYLAQQKALYGG